MLNTWKSSDLRRVLSNFISKDQHFKSLFLDIPELKCFSFECSSEYDDSNYSDHCRLISINDHNIDWDLNYFDEDGDVEESESKFVPIRFRHYRQEILDAVQSFGSEYGYGTHDILRDDFVNRSGLAHDEQELFFVKNYISNGIIEDDWFLKVDPRWACYYAQDHGRLKEKVEKRIFCKRGRMMYAYMYAQAINQPLPEFIENYFMTRHIIDSNEKDTLWLKEYLKFKDSFQNV